MRLCSLNRELLDDAVRRLVRHLRCFWSWPFGHCWHSDGAFSSCCYCGKTVLNY